MFVSKLVRAPFRLMPETVTVPILSGPVRGMRWTVESSVLSCWFGIYERDRLGTMSSMLAPGCTFYDIGAQAGYHSLHGSRCVGREGRVYAFEPLPENYRSLSRHVEANLLRNVEPLPLAVSDREGQLHFDPGPGKMAGKLCDSGRLVVRTISIDRFVQDGNRPPSLMKIDVEGAELRVLQGAARTLRTHRPALIIDTHDFLGGDCDGLHHACTELLSGMGYQRLEHFPPGRFAGALIAYP